MPKLDDGRPKLVNRGAAGLLNQLPGEKKHQEIPTTVPRPDRVNYISQDLRDKGMVVPISTLTYDPDNARLHPEHNLTAIKESLVNYSQAKPVVVQKWTDAAKAAGLPQTNHVVTGNGTMQAASELGWTELAATFMDLTDAEAAGYGLADNRTAELAKWDFEVVARLDKIVSEAGLAMAGWSLDELEVLRAADWVPPAIDDSVVVGGGSGSDDQLIYSFTPDLHEPVSQAINAIRTVLGDQTLDQAQCLAHVCRDWLASKVEVE